MITSAKQTNVNFSGINLTNLVKEIKVPKEDIVSKGSRERLKRIIDITAGALKKSRLNGEVTINKIEPYKMSPKTSFDRFILKGTKIRLSKEKEPFEMIIKLPQIAGAENPAALTILDTHSVVPQVISKITAQMSSILGKMENGVYNLFNEWVK